MKLFEAYADIFEKFWRETLVSNLKKTKKSYFNIFVIFFILSFIYALVLPFRNLIDSIALSIIVYFTVVVSSSFMLEFLYRKSILSDLILLFDNLKGSRRDLIETLFSNSGGMSSEYEAKAGVSYKKIKKHLMKKEEISTLSRLIMDEIGSEGYKEILNSRKIKGLIKSQNGISYYCFFLIIKEVEDKNKNKSIDDIINKMTE